MNSSALHVALRIRGNSSRGGHSAKQAASMVAEELSLDEIDDFRIERGVAPVGDHSLAVFQLVGCVPHFPRVPAIRIRHSEGCAFSMRKKAHRILRQLEAKVS